MTETPSPSKGQPDIETILGLNNSTASSMFERWRMQIISVGAIVGLVFLYLMWGAGGASNKVKFVTAPATKGDLTVIVTSTGSIQPTNKIDVSSELSGTIRRVLVDYNSKVKVGQPLAELDTDKLKASVASAQAKLAAAKARIRDAEATVIEKRLEHRRKQSLVAKKISSTHDLEVALAAYDRALAARESAKAESEAAAADLRLTETNLAKACICSPINGVVLKRSVEPGQTVASSLQAPILFTIAEDLTQMEVQVDVDEADVGKVAEGQTATFTVDAYPDRKFKASIKELRYGSEIVQGVVTYKVILKTDNSEMLLRPGMTATAEITVQHLTDVVSVPNAALRYGGPATEDEGDKRGFIERLTSFRPKLRKASKSTPTGRDRVIWFQDGDGSARQVGVTIGVSDGKRTQIVTGDIKPDTLVIVDTVTAKR